jgi:plastocyanin
VRRWLAAAVLAVIVIPLPAEAAGADVSIDEYSFSPKALTTKLGDSVIWENDGALQHSAVADAGRFFDTGTIAAGMQRAEAFPAAGSFPYHCAFHPGLMHGTVRIRLRVSTNATSVGTAIRLIAAEATVQAGTTFDYQRRFGAGVWKTIKSGVAKARIRVRPRNAGTYRFRSRAHAAGGGASGWSPAARVVVAAG